MIRYKGDFVVSGPHSLLIAFQTELINAGYNVEHKSEGLYLDRIHVLGYNEKSGKNEAKWFMHSTLGGIQTIELTSHWVFAMNRLKQEEIQLKKGLWVTYTRTLADSNLLFRTVRIASVESSINFKVEKGYTSSHLLDVYYSNNFRVASESEIVEVIKQRFDFKLAPETKFTSVAYFNKNTIKGAPSWDQHKTLDGIVGMMFHYDMKTDTFVTGGYGAHVLYKDGVYAKPRLGFPIIKGHGATHENGILRYGCATFTLDFIKALWDINMHQGLVGNRTVDAVVLSSGVTVTMRDINQIMDTIRSNDRSIEEGADGSSQESI